MGAFLNLVDAVLLIFFLVIAVAAPLIDAQTCLPLTFFPDFLVHLKSWYTLEYGDYLVAEKPDFFVGLVWLELLFQWPLALLNIYGILGSKPWFQTTCLMYGVSVFTSMTVILSELSRSPKASPKLLTLYFPFLGLGVMAMLRGLLPQSKKRSTSAGKIPATSGGKKRA